MQSELAPLPGLASRAGENQAGSIFKEEKTSIL